MIYFVIAILCITVFVGGLFGAFQAGKESGICQYGYKEDNDEISDDDE
jgi:hypothetical protein